MRKRREHFYANYFSPIGVTTIYLFSLFIESSRATTINEIYRYLRIYDFFTIFRNFRSFVEDDYFFLNFIISLQFYFGYFSSLFIIIISEIEIPVRVGQDFT